MPEVPSAAVAPADPAPDQHGRPAGSVTTPGPSTHDTDTTATDAGGDAPLGPAALASELRIAVLRSSRRIRLQRSTTVTDSQYSVLARLDKHGPSTPRDLAEWDHVQPPSMTRTVNCLADAGLVERSPHPDDGRQVLVALTEEGTRVVHDGRRRLDAWLAQRLAELDDHERAVLQEATGILRRVISP